MGKSENKECYWNEFNGLFCVVKTRFVNENLTVCVCVCVGFLSAGSVCESVRIERVVDVLIITINAN